MVRALSLSILLLGWLAALPAAGAEPIPAPPSPTTPPVRLTSRGLSPCEVPGLEGGGATGISLCGTIPVWENRVTRQGRKLDLKIVVLAATSAHPAPDPVFYITGGPGYSSAASAGDLGQFLGALRADRDLVFVDQRGMGGSNPLRCPNPGSAEDPQGYLRDLFPLEALRACRPQLEARADLTQYTTAIAMDDLDEVRERLGYGRINLIGTSYGTRAAQTYIRQHPRSVRSAVLAGVMIIDARMPLYLAREAQESIDKLFDDCGGAQACREAFPDPRGDLARALARFERGPVRQKIRDAKSGGELDLALPRGAFTTALRSLQYSPGASSRIPLYLHQAAAGDFEAITRVAIDYFADPDWYLGAYQSIVCAEDVARIDPAEIPGQIAETYMGDDRLRQQIESCKIWPRADLPEGFFAPLRSDAPILLITGWLDPATPPEWAAEVQKTLPNSLNVVIRDGAHGPGGLEHIECWGKLMTDFIQNGTPFGLDTSCVAGMKRTPFALKVEPK
jgi:pimeloyl-ACP methyl ester carboxylesterase